MNNWLVMTIKSTKRAKTILNVTVMGFDVDQIGYSADFAVKLPLKCSREKYSQERNLGSCRIFLFAKRKPNISMQFQLLTLHILQKSIDFKSIVSQISDPGHFNTLLTTSSVKCDMEFANKGKTRLIVGFGKAYELTYEKLRLDWLL